MTTPAITEAPSNFALISTPELRSELAQTLEITARHLVRLAAIWAELERRGEDLSNLRSGLWSYMRAIAAGNLRPEIVVQYAGHTMLLNRLATLQLEDQDRLLADKTVPLVEYQDGQMLTRFVPITQLRASQIGQVIADRIRTPEEQRGAALRLSRRGSPGRPPARGQTKSAAVLSAAAEQPRGIPGATRRSLTCLLSENEWGALVKNAEQAGVSLSAVLRATLINCELLTPTTPPSP